MGDNFARAYRDLQSIGKMNKLLVIIPDYLSAFIAKGEITERYYNPGELFGEVHILMTNDDRINPEDVQKMVGRAELHIHSLGDISFLRVLSWCSFLFKPWVNKVIALAQEIQPSLLRTHGNYMNGYFAAQIKKQLYIPLVVSLHTHPDESARARTPWLPTWKQRLVLEIQKTFERETLRNADCVIPVYESIREYALHYGAKRVEVIYNVINPTHLQRKTYYELHQPPRIISVGRQIAGKNPENLIRAIRDTDAELTLVGNGEYHEYLKSVAQEYGIADRVSFKPAVSNDELCEMLPDYDLFAVHNDYWGIPKAVIEPLLTGLPVVINRRYPEPVPELDGDWVMLVENTKEGYLNALRRLLTDDDYRKSLGQRGYDYAWEHFAPDKMEQKVVDLYRELVAGL